MCPLCQRGRPTAALAALGIVEEVVALAAVVMVEEAEVVVVLFEV